MNKYISDLIQVILRGIGIRSLDKQFLFSYSLIALFTSIVAAHLIISYSNPMCQPKHEPADFEITYKSGCLGELNAKANHSS